MPSLKSNAVACANEGKQAPISGDDAPLTLDGHINLQYHRLVQFLAARVSSPHNGRASSRSLSRKPARLSLEQLSELVADLCDELDRRQGLQGPAFLPLSLRFSPQRNQARKKLGELRDDRLADLITSIVHEMERRFPDLKLGPKEIFSPLLSAPPPTPTEENLVRTEVSRAKSMCIGMKEADEMTDGLDNDPIADSNNGLKKESNTTSLPAPKAIENNPFDRSKIRRGSLLEKRLSVTQGSFNFDCLDSLLQDLNAAIGKEQNSEILKLKERHEAEIGVLKEYIQHLEEQVLPDKNREIARLAANLEQAEGTIAQAKRDVAHLRDTLADKDRHIQEQCIIIANVQNAYQQLQQQISAAARNPAPKKHAIVSGKDNASLTAIMRAFEQNHNRFIKAVEDPSAANADRLSVLKDLCEDTGKLLRQADDRIMRCEDLGLVDVSESLKRRKADCMQAVSYCVVCGKDLAERVKSLKEMKEAIAVLVSKVEALYGFINDMNINALVDPVANFEQKLSAIALQVDANDLPPPGKLEELLAAGKAAAPVLASAKRRADLEKCLQLLEISPSKPQSGNKQQILAALRDLILGFAA